MGNETTEGKIARTVSRILAQLLDDCLQVADDDVLRVEIIVRNGEQTGVRGFIHVEPFPDRSTFLKLSTGADIRLIVRTQDEALERALARHREGLRDERKKREKV